MITTVDGLRFGQLVRSMAGRDDHQFYLIFNMIGDRFIEVVDGDKHPVNKPKKKNVKHLKVTMMVAKEIEASISKGELIDNFEIVTAIKRLKNELEEGDRFHG